MRNGEHSGDRASASISGSGYCDIAACTARSSSRRSRPTRRTRPSIYCAILWNSGDLSRESAAKTPSPPGLHVRPITSGSRATGCVPDPPRARADPCFHFLAPGRSRAPVLRVPDVPDCCRGRGTDLPDDHGTAEGEGGYCRFLRIVRAPLARRRRVIHLACSP